MSTACIDAIGRNGIFKAKQTRGIQTMRSSFAAAAALMCAALPGIAAAQSPAPAAATPQAAAAAVTAPAARPHHRKHVQKTAAAPAPVQAQLEHTKAPPNPGNK